MAKKFAGRYIEIRMRRVHLSMRTEGIKAFSKRIRRCYADGRKRYENDVWTQIFLETEQNSSVFVWKRILVSRVKPFSSPEAALLLAITKTRDLWPSPTPEVRDSRTSRHSAHVQSQVWQIWLWSQSIVLTKPFKNGMSLDQARGRFNNEVVSITWNLVYKL